MQIKTVAEINKYTGRSVNPMDFPDQLFELYSVPCFETGYPEIIKGKEIGSTKITVEEGDVLICKINPRINRVWVVKHNTEHPLLASSEWIVVRNNEIDSDYLKCYFSSPTFRTLLTSQVAGIGGSLTRAQPKQVAKYPVPVPNALEQKRISNLLNDVSRLISLRKEQLAKLDQLVKSRFIELFVATDAASDWPYCTIADVSNDMRTGPFGSALHHDEFVDSGVFVLGIDNAVENKFSYNRMRYITAEKYRELKRYTVYPGDVIITIMGTVGRSAVIPADMPKAINTKHLACITPNAKMVNAQFLSCAFQVHPDIRAQLQKQCKGAIMDGLNLTIIKGLSFHIPPINLQDRFVGFYEHVDKSKLTIQQSLDKLEVMKKAMMQEYFG